MPDFSAADLLPLLPFIAAGFFAVYAGHQEAVMWYAALPELLLFLFCGLFLLTWIRYVRGGSLLWAAAATLCFVLTLGSKEAGVVLIPAAALLSWKHRRGYAVLASLTLLSGGYAWAIFAAKSQHLHLNDGTFSLRSPFPITWARSFARLAGAFGPLTVHPAARPIRQP